MTIQDFQKKITSFVSYLQNDFQRDVTLVGVTDMAGKIRNRVQNKGDSADGGMFRPYSTRPTLVGRSSFRNPANFDQLLSKSGGLKKQLKRKGEIVASGMHWVTVKSGDKMVHLVVLSGGYRQLRVLDKLPVDFKNFTRTGFMWKDFGVQQTGKQKFTLKGKTERSQKLINVNSWREKKNVIQPNEKEIKELNNFVNSMILKKLKETGVFK